MIGVKSVIKKEQVTGFYRLLVKSGDKYYISTYYDNYQAIKGLKLGFDNGYYNLVMSALKYFDEHEQIALKSTFP